MIVDQSLRPFLPPDQPPLSRASLHARRIAWAERNAMLCFPDGPDSQLQVIQTPDGPLDLFIFTPETAAPKTAASGRPALIWLHGGGYITGHGRDMWHGPMFAARTGATVISVDYRLAPEHPFPAALHDAVAALEWAHAQARPLGIDPTRIAIGGASAGAGLAAGLALYNRDHARLAIRFQLLLYPMLDNMHDTASGRTPQPAWPREMSLAAWEMYLDGSPNHDASPYAAPGRATDLSGLPPAYLSVGEADLFLDETRDYAKRLAEGELSTYAGMFHGAERAGIGTPIGQKMTEDYVAALQRGVR